jgi:hypothetical protein
MNSQGTNTTRPQISCFTPTFDAKTMVEVPENRPKRKDKAKSQAIWRNRNMTCDLHKRQKKEVKPTILPLR